MFEGCQLGCTDCGVYNVWDVPRLNCVKMRVIVIGRWVGMYIVAIDFVLFILHHSIFLLTMKN